MAGSATIEFISQRGVVMRENRSAIVDTIISAIANIAIATIYFNNTHSHARNHVSCDHRINVIFTQ